MNKTKKFRLVDTPEKAGTLFKSADLTKFSPSLSLEFSLSHSHSLSPKFLANTDGQPHARTDSVTYRGGAHLKINSGV